MAVEHCNFIGGAWVESSGINRNLNPSDLDQDLGTFASADAQQVATAIEAAAHAQPRWAGLTSEYRSDCLDRVATELLARAEELGRLLASEEGKTLPEATGEVRRAGRVFKYFAGEALRISGDHMASVREGVTIETSRVPEGVIGLITPWNFPIAIPAWKIAPALAYGNAVVFKPAELVPASAFALAEIISRAGLPDGAFNLVSGRGSIVGPTLVESPLVRAISFTGSEAIGRGLAIRAAVNGVKVQLEMGGKNPLVVMDDADLDIAVTCAIEGAFFSTGQRCTATSRIIVHEAVHDRFVEALVARMTALRVGHALEPETDIGPVVSETQLSQNLDYVEVGRQEGACLVTGGERLDRPTRGLFMSPALFTETTNQMRINQEEIFGPIATVIRVKNFDEALATANDTVFGLSSGICTTSLKHAAAFKAGSAAGMTMVNLATAGVDYHTAFGGRKHSSYGPREQGSYAREFYTAVQVAYTRG